MGGTPGSRGSGVPGPRIGYMPQVRKRASRNHLLNINLKKNIFTFQELALYGEFTIRETLIYFGWIAGMTTSEVDEKMDFLVRLLQMPTVTRFIKNLSGGQQRRMSLAAALLHGKMMMTMM